jgi:hypothetical protein
MVIHARSWAPSCMDLPFGIHSSGLGPWAMANSLRL